MSCLKMLRRSVCVALAMVACSQAMAGVVITGTRMIYPAGQKEITVKLNNNGMRPALVQAWVDTGDVQSSPTSSKAPFVLSPPVSRIDPSKGQSLRLMFTGVPLPANKESVFWLNILEIPPKAEGPVDLNVLQMAFRSRIKIFYRPDGLTGSATDAPALVQWKIIPQGQGYALQAFNPTPFHVSLVELNLAVGGKRFEGENGMVGPGATQVFAVSGLKSAPGTGQVEFNAINDYGALMPIQQPLKP
ncbi:fimbria/pilus periplasmic chaperone [Pseudomonas costantinii]|uniref:Chaperone protein EcpD n=1 Tax=Pseudomonas costantinii TaxID=168469 RepID=A0A1S2UM60_9PSED|nr:fimbria/pilus periplasmic chaperone [Pseudomonas costantinii]NVZ18026.1 fimbria/pilus periplasmic chaperone [Pseudomonas costantinii]OIN47325.1 molecular chaperone EcpD [Pseudomonas costantinii]SEE46519.1 chaperone protein EcpD [Pseudomonas costantinii]